jgi:enamine deaminase RidA (YjgF/YER057c/UK114 family)
MSRWEAPYGYQRARRVGDRIITSGTTAPGDTVAAQASAAFGIALDALAGFGATAADVVRTRMYITDRAFADEVGQVHGALFGAVRPVTTMVVVAGLIDESLLVEVEVEAQL